MQLYLLYGAVLYVIIVSFVSAYIFGRELPRASLYIFSLCLCVAAGLSYVIANFHGSGDGGAIGFIALIAMVIFLVIISVALLTGLLVKYFSTKLKSKK
jgi:hypothetical protein